MSAKTNRTYSKTALLLVALLSLAAVLLTSQLLPGARIDLTENDLYTLSDGTLSVLEKIEEPINLYFFYSAEAAKGIPQIVTHAQRVKEMLQEMAAHADGKLKLQIINPEPFSEEEDRATQLGVESVPLNANGDALYLGIAGTNAVDQTEAIPFVQPDRATTLEYDIAKMIYQLNQGKRPVVGMIAQLPISGTQPTPFQQQGTPPWNMLAQLREFFEIRDLGFDAKEIGEDISVLMLVHPAHLSDETKYAIDQFVLGGGNLMVFVDPYSAVAADSASTNNMVDEPLEPASDLPKLFATWGVKLKQHQVLLDADGALSVNIQQGAPPVFHYAMFTVDENGMNQDDIITQGLGAVNFGFAGVIEPVEGAMTTFEPLLSSSQVSSTAPAYQMRPNMDPAELQRDFAPLGTAQTVAARISGKVKSAFGETPPEDLVREGGHLAESKGDINVVVVSDTDVLTDRMWVQVQNFLGQQIATPWAGNGDFVLSAVDNLMGSSDLIGIRTRADYSRPFTKVNALKREADVRFRAKEEELQQRLRETERQLSQLQAPDESGGPIILSDEQRAALLGFQEDKLKIRKQLREVRHQLNQDIERLGSVLKFINIALVPLLLCIVALIVVTIRRRRATAGDAR